MTNPIKTRANGSIDTAHYMSRGRLNRSQAAHDMTRALLPNRTTGKGPGRLWIVPFAIISIAALAWPYMA